MKTVIVTGASSGIGQAVAELFLERGWAVGLLARRADVLEQMADGQDRAIVIPADVTQADQVDAAFEQFLDQTGRLDVLFNNAGIFTPPGLIDEIMLEDC